MYRVLKLFCFLILISNFGIGQMCHVDVVKKNVKNKLHSKIPFDSSATLIKYNGVYLHEFNYGGSVWYYFYRFYPDGSVIQSQRYCSFPNPTERVIVEQGIKSYYVIRNGELIMQMYNSYVRYFFSFLKIRGNKIQENYTLNKLTSKKKDESMDHFEFTFILDEDK